MHFLLKISKKISFGKNFIVEFAYFFFLVRFSLELYIYLIRNFYFQCGLVGLLFVSVLTNHCCKLIVKCKHLLVNEILAKYERHSNTGDNKPDPIEFAVFRARLMRNMDYADIGKVVFGKWGAFAVNAFVVITQCGFCIGYVIFIGNTIHGLIPRKPLTVFNHTHDENSSSSPSSSLVLRYNQKRDTIHITRQSDLDTVSNQSILGPTVPSLVFETDNFLTGPTSVDIALKYSTDTVTTTTVNPDTTSAHTAVNHWNDSVDNASADILVEYAEVRNASLIQNNTIPMVYQGPDLPLLCVATLPLFIMFTYFRTVRQLGIISVMANISIIIGFISVMGYIIFSKLVQYVVTCKLL